jgi:RNA polymerase sigma factor (sigma-70 family)
LALTDAELVARALERDDRHAFAELVRRHQSAVRGLLRKLSGDAALADDLAQETFVRAWKSLQQYQGGARLSSWLYRIAYNAFASNARRAPMPEAPAPAAVTMDAVVARHDLSRAMSRLKPEERTALALTYGQDITHEEAALILQWPLGTLKTHVLRGKNKLREEMSS